MLFDLFGIPPLEGRMVKCSFDNFLLVFEFLEPKEFQVVVEFLDAGPLVRVFREYFVGKLI